MGNQITTLRMGQGFKKTLAGEIPVDWECKTLSEVVSVRYGLGQPPPADPDGIPIIRATNIKKDKIIGEAILKVSRNALPLRRNPLLKEGEIIVVRSGVNTGDTALITKEWAGAVAGYDLVLSPSAQIDSSYCFQYLIGSAAQGYFTRQSGRSAQPHLNAQQLGELPIPLPPWSEQKKIAEILHGFDDAISKTSALIVEMQKLKRGLIQETFVRTSRQNRWRMSSVGECARVNAETLGENTPPDSKIQYIDISSIDSRGAVTQTREIAFKDSPSRARRVVKSGEILVSTVRPYLRAFTKIDVAADNLIASTGFAVLRPRPGVDADFLYQFIRSDRFVNFLVERMTGSNYPAVGANDVADCPIPLPSLDEQRAIGERLLAIDQAVSQTDSSRDRFELMKIGLTRGLLTGKVRVTK